MHISALYIYPVKGIAAVPLKAVRLDAFGLARDRRFMIVDDAGRFVSQREHAQLALLRAELTDELLVLHSAIAGELRVPAVPTGDPVHVRIWNDTVAAIDAGADAAAFVTRHLGFSGRLVYMPDSTLRQADETYARAGDRVSFVDAFPLLLIGAASLEQLNRHLDQPVEMLRFRPSVVVTGAPAHSEDSWRRIRLGSIECDVVKPCARCVVTTIDPATAVATQEPLRTLATYRKAEGHVYFGQNIIHRARGTLQIGDPVSVLAVAEPRPRIASA